MYATLGKKYSNLNALELQIFVSLNKLLLLLFSRLFLQVRKRALARPLRLSVSPRFPLCLRFLFLPSPLSPLSLLPLPLQHGSLPLCPLPSLPSLLSPLRLPRAFRNFALRCRRTISRLFRFLFFAISFHFFFIFETFILCFHIAILDCSLMFFGKNA